MLSARGTITREGQEGGPGGRQASWGSWTPGVSLGPGPRPPERAGAESGPHRPGETDTQFWPLPEARVASSVSLRSWLWSYHL